LAEAGYALVSAILDGIKPLVVHEVTMMHAYLVLKSCCWFKNLYFIGTVTSL